MIQLRCFDSFQVVSKTASGIRTYQELGNYVELFFYIYITGPSQDCRFAYEIGNRYELIYAFTIIKLIKFDIINVNSKVY